MNKHIQSCLQIYGLAILITCYVLMVSISLAAYWNGGTLMINNNKYGEATSEIVLLFAGSFPIAIVILNTIKNLRQYFHQHKGGKNENKF